MPERHELEAFLTLAEELHFGHTAERLRVSTARVSQTIRKLERRIGAPLFNRTSRRVELSPLGRQLHDDLGPAWTQITAAFSRAIETGRGFTETLRIGFLDAAGGQLLAGAAAVFREHHPACDVHLREAQLADLVPWLRAGEVDLALAPLPVAEPGIVTGPTLVTEARFLAVPAAHPFARRPTLSFEELARVAVLRQADGTLQELLTLVGSGQGALPVGAHIRRYHPRPDVAYVHLDDAPPLHWCLVWHAGGATARLRAFTEAALAWSGNEGRDGLVGVPVQGEVVVAANGSVEGPQPQPHV